MGTVLRLGRAGKDYISVEDLREHLAIRPEPPLRFTFRYRWNRAITVLNGDIGSMFEGPQVDAPAPDFTLKTHDGQSSVTLSQFQGARPVVLILGSFTCPNFRSHSGILEQLYAQYGNQAAFLRVHIREAHPADGWATSRNEQVGICVNQPVDWEGRLSVAQDCYKWLGLSMPLLVDEMDDRVGHAYSGMPDRLYLIDRQGKVVYKSGRGPFGFKPAELEQSLVMLLLDAENREKKGLVPAAQRAR